MKRISLIFSIVLMTSIFSLLIVACQKSSTNSEETTTKVVKIDDFNSIALTEPQANRTFDEVTFECAPPAMNCLPDVIITAVFTQLSAAIDEGNVPSFFASGAAEELRNYFGSAIFDSIANGTYTVIQQYNQSGSTNFYFAGPSSGFLIQNADVVIPVNN